MNSALYPARFAAKTAAASISDRAVVFLLAAALFTYPLQQVGVELFGYPVTPSFVAIVLLSIPLLLRPMRLLPRWKIALLVLVWSAGTAVATGNFLSLCSVGVFAILLLPTVLEIPSAMRCSIVTWFLRGGILNLAMVAVDAVRLKFGLPQFDTIIPFVLPGSVEEWDMRYAGFPRVRAMFYEPSLCAMYLAFLVIFLDLLPSHTLSARKRNVLRVLFIASLLLCRGMAGYVILGAYAAAHITLYIIGQCRRPRITRVTAAAGTVLMLTVIAGLLWKDSLGSVEKWTVVPQRLHHALVALGNPQIDRSSESERLGLLAVSVAYLTSGSLEQAIAGEGFNSAEEWMSKTYAGVGGGWARGVVTSGFTILLLGTGLVGFMLYLLYLRTLTPAMLSPPGASRLVPRCCFLALILVHFGTGLFINTFLWGLLYVYLFTLHPSPLIPHPSSLIPDREVAANG